MPENEYTVTMQHDPETNRWLATSNDIPGLVLEDASYDVLVYRVRLAAPEMLELNGINVKNFTLNIHSERREQVRF